MQFRADIGDRNIRTMYRCHSQFPHGYVYVATGGEVRGIILVRSIFYNKLSKKIQNIVISLLQTNIK